MGFGLNLVVKENKKNKREHRGDFSASFRELQKKEKFFTLVFRLPSPSPRERERERDTHTHSREQQQRVYNIKENAKRQRDKNKKQKERETETDITSLAAHL